MGRLGDNKVGDDSVNEGRRITIGERSRRSSNDGRRRRSDVPQPLPPPPPLFEDGEGGNFWVNPTNSMDRYPEPAILPMIDDNVRPGEMLMMPRRAGRRRRIRYDDDDDDGEWWETRRRERIEDDEDYYVDDDDDNEMFDRFDDDYIDSEEDGYVPRSGIGRRQRRGGEYGVPPPTRSR